MQVRQVAFGLLFAAGWAAGCLAARYLLDLGPAPYRLLMAGGVGLTAYFFSIVPGVAMALLSIAFGHSPALTLYPTEPTHMRLALLFVVNSTLLALAIALRRMVRMRALSYQGYRSIFENVLDPILVHDMEGRILDANRQMEKLLDHTRDELRRMTVSDVISPGENKADAASAEELRAHRTLTRECRLQSKDGRTVIAECHVCLLPDSRVVAIFHDVTARQGAEAALRLSERVQRRLAIETKAILDALPAEVAVLDRSGKVISGNGAWLRRAENTAAGAGFGEGSAADAGVRAVLAGTTPQFELEYARPSSQGRRWLRLMVSPMPAGAVVMHMDITARKEAEEAVRRAKETLATLIEFSPLAIISYDLELKVTTWNKSAEQMFGWTAEEVVSKPLPNIAADVLEDSADIAAMRTRGESLQGIERQRRRKDESTFDARIWSCMLGDAAGCLCLVADDSAEKRLREQLLQAQKMEAIGQLAGGVAHDFNNLLTVILGFSQMMTQRFPTGGSAHYEAMEIMKAAHRASALTSQLLAFSRRQVFQPRVLDLNELIGNLAKMLRRLIGEDIELRISLDPALGSVVADPNQIEQVVLNLAINARDAMPNGGQLAIETMVYEPGQGDGSAGSHALLSVSDTGEGMDEAVKSRLFEPFFTTKELGKGTGLGLSTVFGIVKQSGGEIWVESAPARGSTFRISLPTVVESVAAVACAAIAEAAGGSETILVAEDEPGVRQLICELLVGWGYEVLDAARADEAVRKAEQFGGEIDLLVTDVVLPEVHGPALASQLRSVRPGIKTLFVSGYSDEAIAKDGVLAQGLAFLQKPFSPDALRRKVREVLDAKADSAAA